MPTMEWMWTKPTGRRFVCNYCGEDVAEVEAPNRPQLALHYVGNRVCDGAGEPSETTGRELAPPPDRR